jgi:hypothetical protein
VSLVLKSKKTSKTEASWDADESEMAARMLGQGRRMRSENLLEVEWQTPQSSIQNRKNVKWLLITSMPLLPFSSNFRS